LLWCVPGAIARREHVRISLPKRQRPPARPPPAIIVVEAAAALINAEPGDVALISSVGYGVATAGKILAVPNGSRVLLLEDDHSSPVLEWMTRAPLQGFSVEVVPRPADGDWTAALSAAIERPGAPPVGLASISSVHWSDGGAIDLPRRRLHQSVGIALDWLRVIQRDHGCGFPVPGSV